MKKLSIIVLITAFALCNVEARPITITGTVTSADDGSSLPGVNIVIKGTSFGVVTDLKGNYTIGVPSQKSVLVFSFIGMVTEEIKVGKKTIIDVAMMSDAAQLEEVVVSGIAADQQRSSLSLAIRGSRSRKKVRPGTIATPPHPYAVYNMEVVEMTDNEDYASIDENTFKDSKTSPLSTFSIDVDAASYSNVRRFLNMGQMPPTDAVRIEEMINYFDYDYEQPTKEHPFSVHTELSQAPWNSQHQLLHIGLQGKIIPQDNLPASNLVFLIDVSGSMSDYNKLPLLKSAFKMMVENLREEDKVSIVVYAGAAGVVLNPTRGDKKGVINAALDHLNAGGSTAGGAGINLAYKLAKENFVDGGNNRVILATDGDFNVGASSNSSMESLIEQKRDAGIFLTVLGFGMGNYKDSKMEVLADKGNGNYAYIDNITEAQKVLVSEFGGTLFTIAKDVKLQIEFNPAKVDSYRLIGYVNRKLNDEDFNDDKKDAGELGSGHSVTALYEIVPFGTKRSGPSVDPLKYQKNREPEVEFNDVSSDLVTVKLRYKKPDGTKSRLLEHIVGSEPIEFDETSNNFKWSAAVAGFGMLLSGSEFANDLSYSDVESMARSAKGHDENGYRSEMIKLVKSCNMLARR